MVAAAQSVATGIFQLALLSLAPVLLFWVFFNARKIADVTVTIARRLHLVPPRKPTPSGPPLERIAADIRRIAASLEALPPRAPAIRRQGVVLAYDEALAAACRALDVEDNLTRLPIGTTRDAERFRVECQLEYAGLVIDPLDPPRAA